MEAQPPLQNHSKPSPWGNYFKEFLMLFLAVFCGFLAENLREERNEKENVRTYIKSLLEDLKRDSADIEWIRSYHTTNLKALDTLKNEIALMTPESDSHKAYRLLAFGFQDFMANDGTYEQLKNEGGLKAIGDKEIIDSLMLYYNRIKRLNAEERIANDNINELAKLSRYFDVIALETQPFTTIPMLDAGRSARNDLYSSVENWRLSVITLEKHRQKVMMQRISLRKTIRKKYPDV